MTGPHIVKTGDEKVSIENKQHASGGDLVTNLIESLSRRAEAALSQRAGPSPDAFAALSPEAAQQLLHDLQVHQIELEMQNEELRRTHTALEASRSHYVDFFDLAPVGYCTVTEKGLIREVNLTTCALLNVTRSQLIKQPISKFIFNDDQGIYYGLRNRLRDSGGSLSCELRLLQRDDTPFFAHLVVSAVQDDDGVSELRIVLSEITERKRLEQELHDANVELIRQSESRYRTLIKLAPEPLVVHDGEKIIFANPATVKMLGAASDKELVGKGILELVHPDSRDIVRERLRAAVEQGVRVPLIEEKCLKLDGTPVDVEVQSRPIDFAGMSATLISMRDISERKLRDARLLENMADIRLHEQAMSQISQGVLISEANRLTTYVNDEFVRITGYSREEMLGKPCSILQGPNSQPDVVLQMRAALDAKQPFHGEILNYRKDGTPFWNDVSINPVFDEAGDVTQFVGIQRDVTQRKLAEESLRIAAVAFESQQAMFITDPQQVILRINKGFSGITGYTADEAVGQTPRLLSSGKHDADFYAAMWDCVSRTGQWYGEIWSRRKNGVVYPQQLNISTVKDAQGLPTHYVGTFSDITSAKSAQEQIESLAFSDLLTGLPNRRKLILQLKQAMIAREREKHQCALLMLDLDNFKNLNDAIGHAQGDEVLQRVAKRLNAATRDGDTVARLGGDEFVVLLDHLNQDPQVALRQTQTVANKMLEALKKPYHLAGSTNSCTASIGITFFGEKYEDTLEPLKRVELAMYQAKAGGGNTIRFFDPRMQAVVDARVNLEAAFNEAIQNQQFELYYQAQVSDRDGIVGVEALVRWFDPKRGMVSPAEFIPLAEETGLILPIGSWVLETACQQLAAWADQPAMAHLSIAVNVSARQFRENNFVSQTLATLERTRANPQRLKLELTESVLIADAEDVIVKMNALKAIGIGFAIDDFGTGYSSLSYIKRLPLDRLKIDQSFVRNILMDANDAAISRAVIAMATSMGLGVMAEGVETEAQRDFLASLGCHTYQGYLFSKPLPIQEFEAFATRF